MAQRKSSPRTDAVAALHEEEKRLSGLRAQVALSEERVRTLRARVCVAQLEAEIATDADVQEVVERLDEARTAFKQSLVAPSDFNEADIGCAYEETEDYGDGRVIETAVDPALAHVVDQLETKPDFATRCLLSISHFVARCATDFAEYDNAKDALEDLVADVVNIWQDFFEERCSKAYLEKWLQTIIAVLEFECGGRFDEAVQYARDAAAARQLTMLL